MYAAQLLVQPAVVDDHAAVVGVELLADHPHGQLRLAVQQRRLLGRGGLGGDLLPLVEQQRHVGAQLVLGGVLGGGAHDQPVLGRLDAVEDRPQPLAHVVGQPLGDAVRLRVGDQHDEAAGQRDLLGEPRALGPDRVLRDLADDQLAGPQDVLDACPVAALLDVLGVVLHVAAVEHGVLRRGDVDERRLHAGQHVLHPADVDVPVDLADVVGGAADVVLDQVAALEHGDLGHVLADLDAHQVAPDRPPVALPAAARLGPSPSTGPRRLRPVSAAGGPLALRARRRSPRSRRPTAARPRPRRRRRRVARRRGRRRRRAGVADLRLADERPLGRLRRDADPRAAARAARLGVERCASSGVGVARRPAHRRSRRPAARALAPALATARAAPPLAGGAAVGSGVSVRDVARGRRSLASSGPVSGPGSLSSMRRPFWRAHCRAPARRPAAPTPGAGRRRARSVVEPVPAVVGTAGTEGFEPVAAAGRRAVRSAPSVRSWRCAA